MTYGHGMDKLVRDLLDAQRKTERLAVHRLLSLPDDADDEALIAAMLDAWAAGYKVVIVLPDPLTSDKPPMTLSATAKFVRLDENSP